MLRTTTASWMVLVCTLFIILATTGASAERAVVTLFNGAVLRSAPSVDAPVNRVLPQWTYVSRIADHNRYVQVRAEYPDGAVTGFVWYDHIAATTDKVPAGQRMQRWLVELGKPVGAVDGKLGPKSMAAINAYIAERGFPPSTPVDFALHNALAASILEKRSAAIAAEQAAQATKERRTAADLAFSTGQCTAFGEADAHARRNRTVADCERAQAARALVLATRALRCDEAAALAVTQAERQQVADCRLRARRDAVTKELAEALQTLDCTRVEGLAQVLNDRTAAQTCRDRTAAAARKADEDRLRRALAAQDCATVDRLAAALNRPADVRRCKIDKALAANTARAVFLAAGLFDANGDRQAAAELYQAVVERFPEDDLALQAVTRMASLRDMADAERLQQQAAADRAAAERAAAEARQAAERQQAQDAAAQRQRESAAATARQRASACGHVYDGRLFRLTQDKRMMDNAKSFLKTMIAGGLHGNNFIVLRVHPDRGIALVQGRDTGKLHEFPCNAIPR